MNTAISARRPARMYSGPSARTLPTDWTKPLLDIGFEPGSATVWANLAPHAPSHVSTDLLRELAALSAQICGGRYGPLRYKVISSGLREIFSLGGDLEFFLGAIARQDRDALFQYGKAAIDEVWANVTGCGRRDVTTVAVVEGEAQGGGFEAVLSCHVIVAETGTHFGFPESLFGLFPGMGAAPLLAARTDEAVASRLVAQANRYSAEFLREIGVIDYVVARGTARSFALELLDEPECETAVRRKAQFEQLDYNSLLQSVEQWVDAALALSDKSKRSMSYLLRAQRRIN